ncbi:MAG TPA: radical SAM protein [Polyangia bacterium]|jgi:pyruvate-formate lyase-activating enzyme
MASPGRSAAFARLEAALGPLRRGREVALGARIVSAIDAAVIGLRIRVGGETAPVQLWLAPRGGGASFARTASFEVRYDGPDLPPQARAVVQVLVARLAAVDHTALGPEAFATGVATNAAVEAPPLDLAVFPACDNQCRFCTNRPTGIAQVPLDAILARVVEGRRAGTNCLELSAMEPTLDRRLPEIVAEARRVGYTTVHLVTNGHRLARREVARGYLDAGITRVTLSLHAPDDATEARLTANPRSFGRKLQALETLAALGAAPAINSVLTPANLPLLPRLAALIAGAGVTRWNLYFPLPSGNAQRNFDEVVPRLEDLAPRLAAAAAAAREHRLTLSVVDVPPCVVGAEVPVGRRIDKVIANQIGREGAPRPPGQERVHAAPCTACSVRPACPGVFEEIVARRGCAALRPRAR